MAQLVLNLLGTFQAILDGRPVDGFEYDKVRALLAYLAVESDRPHRREKLIGLLWPGYPERAARRNLTQALYSLRNALGDRDAAVPTLLVTHRTIQLNPASEVQLDVDRFLAAVERGTLSELEAAEATYRGRFLSGLLPDDCPVFDEWVALRREALHQRAVEMLHRLAGAYQECNRPGDALRVARRQVALDPYWEAGRRTVMRLLAANGQRNAALREYEELRELLATELGVEPEPTTTAVYEDIRASQGTVSERAGLALRTAFTRLGRDRAYQARVAAVILILMAAIVGAYFVLRRINPRGPQPREPDSVVGGWPDVDLQPSVFNPILKVDPAEAGGTVFLDPMVYPHGKDLHVLCTVATDWPDGPAAISYTKSPFSGARFQGLIYNRSLTGDGDGFDAWAVGMPVLIEDEDGTGWRLYFAGDEAAPFGDGLAVGLATADDPAGPWVRRPEPVLEPGEPGEWDSCSVAPASVVVTERGYQLFYLGSSLGDCTRWSIGRATSRDGIRWIKDDGPVLAPGASADWDGQSLGSLAVRDTGLGWEAFYTGERADGRRAIGYAWSRDGGQTWAKHPENPVVRPEDDPFATDVIQVHSVTVVVESIDALWVDYGHTNGLGWTGGNVRWPIVVDTADDELNADGDCSLREAIEAANRDVAVDGCPAGQGADRVVVPEGTYVLTVGGNDEDANRTGDLDILDDLILQGAGAEATVLDGNAADRVLHNHGATLVVNDLTITNGWVPPIELEGGGLLNDWGSVTLNRCVVSRNVATFGGGMANVPDTGAVARMALNETLVIGNTATGNGGGIMNLNPDDIVNTAAILTVTRSTVADNVADGSLRAMGAGNGGGILIGIHVGSEGSVALVTIVDSTISGNVARGTGQQMGNGGGIMITAGDVVIINSTLSGNRAVGEGLASGFGGGVWVSSAIASGNLTLVNSTVSGNQAAAAGGGLAAIAMKCWCPDQSDPGSACYIYPMFPEGPVVIVRNTIVAGNQAPLGPGCHACESDLVSRGYNLADGTGCLLVQPGDLLNTDPLLGPLADNGGPTWTHLPLPGSPVVDAGVCCDLTTDQRGSPRPVDHPDLPNPADACDIGAVERQR